MPKSVRDQIGPQTLKSRRGQILSGASGGYEVKRSCPANVLKEGYRPCGREMWWSRKLKKFVCDVHGEMN